MRTHFIMKWNEDSYEMKWGLISFHSFNMKWNEDSFHYEMKWGLMWNEMRTHFISFIQHEMKWGLLSYELKWRLLPFHISEMSRVLLLRLERDMICFICAAWRIASPGRGYESCHARDMTHSYTSHKRGHGLFHIWNMTHSITSHRTWRDSFGIFMTWLRYIWIPWREGRDTFIYIFIYFWYASLCVFYKHPAGASCGFKSRETWLVM